MKNQCLAFAALLGAGVAQAQSSVTLFGVVDMGLSNYSSKSQDAGRAAFANPFYLNQGTRTLSQSALSSGNYSSSRLGFRGTEDLGGGLAASFWLEAPISPDDGRTGIASFQRRSTLSLSGNFGEIRLGRDYTPSAWNDIVFDPFGIVGVGRSLIYTAANTNTVPGGSGGFGGDLNYNRASNSIGYFLPPNLGGVYGQFMYALHENTKYDPGTSTPPGLNAVGALNAGNVATTRAGRYLGGRLGYATGPFDIAVSYGNSTAADSFYAGTTDSVKTFNLGSSYDFGPVKLFGELSRIKRTRDYATAPAFGGVSDTDLTGYLIGLTAPVGPGLIRAAYSQVKYDLNTASLPFAANVADPKANKLALGYIHNLSKRTALYATIARISNKNGAALTVGGPAFVNNAVFVPKTSTGYDIGLRHSF